MKQLMRGGHRLPAYRWYRAQLRKRQQRVLFNREHRDAEETTSTDMVLQVPTEEQAPPTDQAPKSPLRHLALLLLSNISFFLFFVSGCLLGGALVDLLVAKQGALSAAFFLCLVTTTSFFVWHLTRQRSVHMLTGHVERTARRMHDAFGRNIEVISLTITPQERDNSPKPTPPPTGQERTPKSIEIEVVGAHIKGDIHPGDLVTVYGSWRKGRTLRVTHLFDHTQNRRIAATGWLSTKRCGEELLFFVALGLATIAFLKAVARLLTSR